MSAKQIVNPKAGTEDGLPQVVLPFECVGTVTAKRVVTIDANRKIANATAAAGNTLDIGIALESGVAGDIVQVCVRGPVIGAICDAAIAAGAALIRDATTAGAVQAAGAEPIPTGTVVGIAMGASYATNTRVDVFVSKA